MRPGDFLAFGIGFDPISLIALVAAVGAGVLVSFLFFRARLAERLRKNRSPSDARWEAAAVGLAVGAIVPGLVRGWDFGWFLVMFLLALGLAFRGRARLLGVAALLASFLVAVLCVPLGRTYSAGQDVPAAAAKAPKAKPPAKSEPAEAPSTKPKAPAP